MPLELPQALISFVLSLARCLTGAEAEAGESQRFAQGSTTVFWGPGWSFPRFHLGLFSQSHTIQDNSCSSTPLESHTQPSCPRASSQHDAMFAWEPGRSCGPCCPHRGFSGALPAKYSTGGVDFLCALLSVPNPRSALRGSFAYGNPGH